MVEGSFVTAEIKAPWVVLETGADLPRVTAGNRFLGEVELIRLGELTSEAIVALADGTRLCAVITTQSISAPLIIAQPKLPSSARRPVSAKISISKIPAASSSSESHTSRSR